MRDLTRPPHDLSEWTRIAPDGMSFPVDFGFAPSTPADPLGVMAPSNAPNPVRASMGRALIGMLEAKAAQKAR